MEPLHYLLMKAHTQLNRRIMGEAANLGLSSGQPKVLECLTHLGESNQKAIAAYCEIEQATVGSILSRMERDRLVRRIQREGNRRSLYVSLTPKGERLGQQMEEVFSHADRAVLEVLSQDEVRQLSSLLEKLCTARQNGKEEGI